MKPMHVNVSAIIKCSAALSNTTKCIAPKNVSMNLTIGFKDDILF